MKVCHINSFEDILSTYSEYSKVAIIDFFSKITLAKYIIMCFSDEHRSAGGSWEEPVSAVRNTPLRRSQRLNSTLDSRYNAMRNVW